MIYNQTVTRLRASVTQDRNNNRILDWEHAARTDIFRVAVNPVSATESDNTAEQRDQVFSDYRVFSRRGVALDVLTTDRIEWNGSVWAVNGDPEHWPHPIRTRGGAVHHTEIDLARVTG